MRKERLWSIIRSSKLSCKSVCSLVQDKIRRALPQVSGSNVWRHSRLMLSIYFRYGCWYLYMAIASL